jgi:hypothetical protein
MLDSQTKAELGLQSNWDKFTSWKGRRNKNYQEATGRSFQQDVPNAEERKKTYEQELREQGIKA